MISGFLVLIGALFLYNDNPEIESSAFGLIVVGGILAVLRSDDDNEHNDRKRGTKRLQGPSKRS